MKFNQTNTALGWKYFQKTYKVPRNLALPKAPTSLDGELTKTFWKSRVRYRGVVNDSEKRYLPSNSFIPQELLRGQEPWDNTMTVEFEASICLQI